MKLKTLSFLPFFLCFAVILIILIPNTHAIFNNQIIVPYNGKIADITHADTNKHFLDLATALGETRKIIAVVLWTERITGTGYLQFYPNEETSYLPTWTWSYEPTVVIKNNTQRLQYSQTVANDDFDLYCFGYVVEVCVSLTTTNFYTIRTDGTYFWATKYNGEIEFNGTDASATVNSAIDETDKGRIFFTAGLYPVKNITMKSDITLEGEGWTTILKLPDGANTDLITTTQNGSVNGYNSHMRIVNMLLQGNYENNSAGYGLRLYGIYASIFENLKIENFYDGGIFTDKSTYPQWSFDNWFDNIAILNFKGKGLYTKQLGDTFFSNCRIGTLVPATSCIDLEGGIALDFTNLHIWTVLNSSAVSSGLIAGHENRFSNFQIESPEGSIYGFTNGLISGYDNKFSNGRIANIIGHGIIQGTNNQFVNVETYNCGFDTPESNGEMWYQNPQITIITICMGIICVCVFWKLFI